MVLRHDTQHLAPQVQQIISNRDENNKLVKTSPAVNPKNSQRVVFSMAIFMKLGMDSTLKFNGMKTMQIHEKFCKQNGTVWFATDSLATGMAEKKRIEFINSIKNGNVVEIYFAIGKNSGGGNDIQYSAEVIDIKTDGDGIPSPEKPLTPDEWKNDKNKIWIKIKYLMPYTKLTAKDFIVASTENVLEASIAHSQYHFGYIKKK